MKIKFNWNKFASNREDTIGPSIVSVSKKEIVLSKIPKSFENLLTSLPEGIVSKNAIYVRTKLYIIY